MEDLREKFDKLVEEWLKYCEAPKVRFSSYSGVYAECEAFKEIFAMGHEALPFIRELYDRDHADNFTLECLKAHGLLLLVHTIVGKDFSIPKKIRGYVQKMEDYTKSWLDKYLAKKKG